MERQTVEVRVRKHEWSAKSINDWTSRVISQKQVSVGLLIRIYCLSSHQCCLPSFLAACMCKQCGITPTIIRRVHIRLKWILSLWKTYKGCFLFTKRCFYREIFMLKIPIYPHCYSDEIRKMKDIFNQHLSYLLESESYSRKMTERDNINRKSFFTSDNRGRDLASFACTCCQWAVLVLFMAG